MNGIYRILEGGAAGANRLSGGQDEEEEENAIPHRPTAQRPDPFFLMDAPQLGERNGSHRDAPDANGTHYAADDEEGGGGGGGGSYAVDVSSKLGFEGGVDDVVPQGVGAGEKAGTVEDVPLGVKGEILYPGDYYAHHAYAGLNLTSLINPVFELSTQPTTQSQEERMNPPYTPFPITTNPPRRKAPAAEDDARRETTTDASSESPAVARGPSSVEYSPIPAADFEDSFDASYVPEHFYDNRIRSHDRASPGENRVFHGLPPAAPFRTSDGEVLAQAAPVTTEAPRDETTTTAPQPATDPTSDVPPPPPPPPLEHQQEWSPPQSREQSDSPSSRIYSAFYSPREIPGIDPSIFGYRKVSQVYEEDSAPVYDLPKEEGNGGEVPSASPGGPNPPDPAQQTLLGPQFFKYLNSLPYALLHRFLDPNASPPPARQERPRRASGRQVLCEWNIKTEPGLYMLMTFHNLSAPYTVDCHGAYIEVERENNGYDARWCGNRMYQAGTRPHVIFAKTEVRINVFDDGDASKSLPTGFEADIEVIDLFDSSDYNTFMRSKAYPHIRRLLQG